MEKKKMVIFVGGTSYSGSTMLDMILSNDPKGYSLGEIHALFRPTRKHHFDVIKKVKENKVWKDILEDGEKNLYLNLFNHFPQIDFFVDSSKTPFWIHEHTEILKKNNIESKHILIYKEPIDLAYSFFKRNKYKDWMRSWINYHRLYFKIIENFITVDYKDLVNEKELLINICRTLGIDFFKNKELFWEKEHHTFFGNRRARIHTTNLDVKFDKNFEKINDKNDYKKIYYKEVLNKKIIEDIKIFKNNNKYYPFIMNVLNTYNITKFGNINESYQKAQSNDLSFSTIDVLIRELKWKYTPMVAKLINKI